MFKKLFYKLSTFIITFAVFLNGAYAAVNINTADAAALQSVKGIGPAKARAILDEREKNGAYKDAADLVARVSGIGAKSVQKLQQEGLSIEAGSTPVDATATSPAAAAASAVTTASPTQQANAAAEK